MMKQFKKNKFWDNYVLNVTEDGKSFVSFNDQLTNQGFFSSEGGSPETALKLEGLWLILNGDFRQEYIEALSKEGDPRMLALEVYDRHKATKRSAWSTDDVDDPLTDAVRLFGLIVKNATTRPTNQIN